MDSEASSQPSASESPVRKHKLVYWPASDSRETDKSDSPETRRDKEDFIPTISTRREAQARTNQVPASVRPVKKLMRKRTEKLMKKPANTSSSQINQFSSDKANRCNDTLRMDGVKKRCAKNSSYALTQKPQQQKKKSS